MPTYEYKCPACESIVEIIHSIKDDSPKSCTQCSTADNLVVMERLISKNVSGFILKGAWTETQAWKEKRQRVKKNADLAVKQVERYGGGTTLQPNVAGHETESWGDAAKLAKEAGMNPDTYKPMIEKEKSTSKISGVNDATWKAVKEAKGKV